MQRFFRVGASGQDVYLIQAQLDKLGFTCRVDGAFGNRTEQLVKLFQLSVNLNADGVVGPQTWKALNLPSPKIPLIPRNVPNGKTELMTMFGDPMEPGYWKEYGGFCVTPPELDHVFPYTFAGQNGFWCNKLLITLFQRVYQSIVTTGLSNELHTFNGCFNIRNIRGKRNMSTHSWGIAVDHNSSDNMLGHIPKMNSGIVDCFRCNGFVWGGNFNRKDGMHFQYVKGY